MDEFAYAEITLQSPNGRHRYKLHVTDDGALKVVKLRQVGAGWIPAAPGDAPSNGDRVQLDSPPDLERWTL
ncbi:MAG: hypothetical protein IVW54_01765 [Candidatus Binataceae bacterium]|nr:hypothetical protein [Candidatus Binataceae bacterium]